MRNSHSTSFPSYSFIFIDNLTKWRKRRAIIKRMCKPSVIRNIVDYWWWWCKERSRPTLYWFIPSFVHLSIHSFIHSFIQARIFRTQFNPVMLRGLNSLLSNEYWKLFLWGKSGWGGKLMTRLHLGPNLRLVELYLHPITSSVRGA
jgi:hypothetical protein